MRIGMTHFRKATRGLFVAALAGTLWLQAPPRAVLAQQPQAAPTPRAPIGDAVHIVSPTTKLEVIERGAKNIEFKEWITRVDGFDPKVLDVKALNQQVLRVQGLEQGVTSMTVTDKSGQTYSIDVFVTGDARLLQTVLDRAFPNSAIQASVLKGGNILLRGWVTEAQQIASISEIAKLYGPEVVNQIRVGGPQEVQLRVKIMEVQRSKLRTFGMNFAVASHSIALASTPGPIAALTSLTAPLGKQPIATIGPSALNAPSVSAGITGQNFGFQGFLQALKEEGLLKIQAEPVLVTRSGEAARLDNGGEFPIPVPQSLGTITIEWREFGVILEALPIVISPTRLRQQVSAEVSEKDVANGVTLVGTFVPGLTRRKVQSTVEMNFGETLVLGGLISTRINASTHKVPFFGELPLIGAAFSKKRFDHSEVELIVMITPEYVSPISPDQFPPLGPGRTTTFPTDRELYGSGLLEVPEPTAAECPDSDPSFSVKVQTGTPWPGSTISPGPAMSPTIAPGSVPLHSNPDLIVPPGVEPSVDPASASRSPAKSRWPSSSRPVTPASQIAGGRTTSGNTTAQAGYSSETSKSDNQVQRASGQKPATSKPLPPIKF